MATNNTAESPFAGLTHLMECFGRILGINAAATSQARINGDFRRENVDGNKNNGMYHVLPTKLKQSLLTMAINDALTVRRNEGIAIEKQRRHKQNKHDLLKKMKLMKAQQLYINALTYIEMYHSPVEWKTKPEALEVFSKLTSKTAKLEAIKNQIRIRVLGFGWTDLHISWSKDSIHKSPEQLLTHLTDIIIPEQS